MKRLFIFIVFCLSQMPTIFSKQFEVEGRQKETLEECARELHVNAEKFLSHLIHQAVSGSDSDEETTCMLACGTRKALSDDLIGIGKEKTLYEVLILLVNKVYNAGFTHPGVTRADVIDKIRKCHASEQAECQFYKCLNVTKTPFHEIFGFYIEEGFSNSVARQI